MALAVTDNDRGHTTDITVTSRSCGLSDRAGTASTVTRRQAGNARSGALAVSVGDLPSMQIQSYIRQTRLQHRQTIVAPERFVLEQEQRNPKDVVVRGFLLRPGPRVESRSAEVRAIFGGRQVQSCNYSGYGVGLIDLQLTPEEQFVDFAAVFEQAPVFVREQAADQRRGGVVNLERAADYETAGRRPPSRVQVRVFRLVLGIDTALALALDAELERNPADANIIFPLKRERRIEGKVGERTFVVRVHFYFGCLHQLVMALRSRQRILTRDFCPIGCVAQASGL